jgi:hypothetical protein
MHIYYVCIFHWNNHELKTRQELVDKKRFWSLHDLKYKYTRLLGEILFFGSGYIFSGSVELFSSAQWNYFLRLSGFIFFGLVDLFSSDYWIGFLLFIIGPFIQYYPMRFRVNEFIFYGYYRILRINGFVLYDISGFIFYGYYGILRVNGFILYDIGRFIFNI